MAPQGSQLNLWHKKQYPINLCSIGSILPADRREMPLQKKKSKKSTNKTGIATKGSKKVRKIHPKKTSKTFSKVKSGKPSSKKNKSSSKKNKVSSKKPHIKGSIKPSSSRVKKKEPQPKNKEFIIDIDLEVDFDTINKIEEGDDISIEVEEVEEQSKIQVEEREDNKYSRSVRTIFDLDDVDNPLVGTPSEVQKDLDRLALRMQKDPTNGDIFNKIVSYMHKYILGLVFKKYSFIMGYEETDMYQEALIALSKKAIPAFRRGKGMSFLNFAKMCINRHLITILHASKHRCKDIPINTAISLDHNPMGCGEDDDSCPLSNVVIGMEPHDAPYEEIIRDETLEHTLLLIRQKLSGFEQIVLDEYLDDNSYKDSADNISLKHGESCNEKSIDNALLRIRKKAEELKKDIGRDSVPILAN